MPLVETECKRCGKIFTSYSSHSRKYCSRSCYNPPRPNKKCLECGKEFYPSVSRVNYCSTICRAKASRILKKCRICGKVFYGKSKYCSTECRKNGQYSKKEWKCIKCGSKALTGRLYCSPECRKTVKPKKTGKLPKKSKKITISCSSCGKDFERYKKQINKHFNFCSVECATKYINGNKWCGQKKQKKKKRKSISLAKRFDIFDRDGFKCTYCGISAKQGAVLHIDHIIPVVAGGTNKKTNLTTACEDCNLGKGSKITRRTR